jgi:hypothetical protein
VYGVRRPVMYHLFATEMESVSVFNGEALRLFLFGAFCFEYFSKHWLDRNFRPRPAERGCESLCLLELNPNRGLSLLCFAFGGWALYAKQSIIKQIKRETVAKAK